MKKLLQFGVLGLGFVTLLGAACNELPSTPPPSLSIEINEGDLIQYGTTTYVYSYGTKRGITTVEVFEGCGYKWDEVRSLEKADFDKIPDGVILNESINCPKK